MKPFLAVIKIESLNRYDNFLFWEKSIKAAIKKVAIICHYEYDSENNTATPLLKISKSYSEYLKNQKDLIIHISSNTRKKKVWQNRKIIDECLIDNWAKSFQDKYYEV